MPMPRRTAGKMPSPRKKKGGRPPLRGTQAFAEPALHEYGEASVEERRDYRLRTQFKPDIVSSEDAAQAATDFLRVVVEQAQRQHISLAPGKHDVIFGVRS